MSSHPKLGAICPSDLGLKAAFWSRKDGPKGDQEVAFRRILGWVTVSNYVETDAQPVVALVLSTDGDPVFATTQNFPDFVGVYEKEATSAQVIDLIKKREQLHATKGSGGGAGSGGVRPPSTGPGLLE